MISTELLVLTFRWTQVKTMKAKDMVILKYAFKIDSDIGYAFLTRSIYGAIGVARVVL